LTKQVRSCTRAAHSLDGTTHVDVHDRSARVLGNPGGFSHLGRDGPEDLNTVGLFFRMENKHVERSRLPSRQAGCAHHLTVHQTGSESFCNPSRARFRESGHGSEYQGILYLEGADLQHERAVLRFRVSWHNPCRANETVSKP
jgi:hypothetical protein